MDEVSYDGLWSLEPCLDSRNRDFLGLGLVLKSKAKYHAISSSLQRIFEFSNNKPLVIQLVKF